MYRTQAAGFKLPAMSGEIMMHLLLANTTRHLLPYTTPLRCDSYSDPLSHVGSREMTTPPQSHSADSGHAVVMDGEP